MLLQNFDCSKCVIAGQAAHSLTTQLLVCLTPVFRQLALSCGLVWADVTGDFPGVFSSPLASEGLATAQGMSGAHYLGWQFSVTFQALVDEPCCARGILLCQHKVLGDCFNL